MLFRSDGKKIRPGFPARPLILGAGLLALCAGTLLLPGSGDRAVAARRALEQKISALSETLDGAAASEAAGLTEAEQAGLRKLTEDLKRDLRASRDETDALVALDRAEQQLEKLHAEQRGEKTAGDAGSAREAMNALAQAMQAAGMDPGAAAALPDALTAGDAAALRAALEGLDPQQLRSLAESLSGDAKALAEQLAQAAEQGEMTEAQLQAMTAGMQAGSSQQSALQKALSGMKAALASGQQPGGQNGQSSGGQGAGNPQGQPGGGAGTGSTNREQKGGGNGGTQSAGKGSRPPEYKIGRAHV